MRDRLKYRYRFKSLGLLFTFSNSSLRGANAAGCAGAARERPASSPAPPHQLLLLAGVLVLLAPTATRSGSEAPTVTGAADRYVLVGGVGHGTQ